MLIQLTSGKLIYNTNKFLCLVNEEKMIFEYIRTLPGEISVFDEIWAFILDSKILISSSGRVHHLQFVDSKGRHREGCFVKIHYNSQNGNVHAGYCNFNFRLKSGKQKLLRLHRVLGEMFLFRPEGTEVVHHINGDHQDNRLENLEWVTYSENQIYRYQKEKEEKK